MMDGCQNAKEAAGSIEKIDDLGRKKILSEVGLVSGFSSETRINYSFSCMKIEMIKSKNLDFHQVCMSPS